MRFISIVAAGALSLSACATPVQPEPEPPLPWGPGVVDAQGCPRELGVPVIGTSPAVARQGATLTVGAAVMNGPYGATDLPVRCLSDWRVSPAGAAVLSADRASLMISPEAAPGAIVTVTAHYRDAAAAARFRVVGRDEVVLTGTWRQDRVKCDPGQAPGEPVRELKVMDDGRFNVTYQPFESYVDIWGVFGFDPASGALTLTPDGGNFAPPIFDGDGTARLEGERRLILDGVYLGDRNERNFEPRRDDKGEWVTDADGRPIVDRPVCTYEFVR